MTRVARSTQEATDSADATAVKLGAMVTVLVPLKTTNPLNGSHGHWSRLAKLRKKQRLETYLRCSGAFVVNGRRPGPPLSVLLTRLAPSNGLDFDGLTAACKSVRDGVSDALGYSDDSHPDLDWGYGQERAKGYGVRIEIRRKDVGAITPR